MTPLVRLSPSLASGRTLSGTPLPAEMDGAQHLQASLEETGLGTASPHVGMGITDSHPIPVEAPKQKTSKARSTPTTVDTAMTPNREGRVKAPPRTQLAGPPLPVPFLVYIVLTLRKVPVNLLMHAAAAAVASRQLQAACCCRQKSRQGLRAAPVFLSEGPALQCHPKTGSQAAPQKTTAATAGPAVITLTLVMPVTESHASLTTRL